ncbi:MAG: DUF4430 domain-containing protein [Promethearchaeota archaeon]
MEKIIKFIFIAVIGSTCFITLLLYNFGLAPFIPSPYNGFDEDGGEGEDNNNDDNTGDDYHENEPQEEVEDITLIVDYDGEKEEKKVEDFSLDDGETTAFDAVNEWCDVEYEVYSNDRYYITYIDGVGEGWVYYVNSDFPDIPVNYYNLEDGDVVRFKYVGT